MTGHRLDEAKIDADPKNPHHGDCTGTRCPICGCCMHCAENCGCNRAACTDPTCQCRTLS